MFLHRNGKLGLAGRLALVRAVEGGLSLKRAAARFSVAPATAHRWWHRWLAASSEERETLRASGTAPVGRTARRGG
jgi:transposase-like protein